MSRKILMLAVALMIPAGAQAQSLERLQVHGYLTQALGQSRDLPVYGMTDNVTADYRKIALQFRYATTDQSAMVVQVGNKRMNRSPLNQETLQLDWGFFEYRLGDKATFRVGRSPLVEGIYNEIRSVGTLIPFYRAPGSFYLEGKETLDGVQASSRLGLGGDWELEPTLGFGTLRVHLIRRAADGSPFVQNIAFEPATTGWTWLNSPIQGVRAGAGFEYWRKEVLDGPDWHAYYLTAAVDATRERYFVRAEARKIQPEEKRGEKAIFAQLGAAVVPAIWLNAQAEWGNTTVNLGGVDTTWDTVRDLALGVKWQPNAFLAFKLEGHKADGYMFDSAIAFPNPKGKTTYFMLSASTAF